MNTVENIRNATASHINVSGTLQNLLNQGFNERDGLCEEIDNSLDSGATKIRLTLDSKRHLYIHADNGCGMSKKKLPEAFTLNNRSSASENKVGRFGIGGLQAKVCLTNLKGKTTTISKQDDCDTIHQLEVDWDECVTNNEYFNKATEASSRNEEIYKKYVTEPFGSNSGTVHIYECDVAVYDTIRDGLSNKQIDESYIYCLEVKYCEPLKKGNRIEVIIDDTLTILHPIDPLQLDKIPEKRKSIVHLEVFHREQDNEIFVHCPKGWITSKTTKTMKKSKINHHSSVNKSELIKIDNCTFESAYSDSWYFEQLELFEGSSRHLYDSIITGYDKNGKPKFNQKAKSIMGGTLYERNGTVVSQFPAKKATSGHKSLYEYKEQSRYRFRCTSKMDDLMKTQVNKSALKEDLFHPTLKQAFDLLEKQFIYKIKPTADDKPDQPSHSEPEDESEQLSLSHSEPEDEPEQPSPAHPEPENEPEQPAPAHPEPEQPAPPHPEPEQPAPAHPEPEDEPEQPSPAHPEPENEPEQPSPAHPEPEDEPEQPSPSHPEPEDEPEQPAPSQSEPEDEPEQPANVETLQKQQDQHPKEAQNLDMDNTTAIHHLIELKEILSETNKFNKDISDELVRVLTETVEPKNTAVFERQWMFISNAVPNSLIDTLIDTYAHEKESKKVAGGSIIQKLINRINSNRYV